MQQDAEVAVDLDAPSGATRCRLGLRGAEERDLRLAGHRARAVEVLPPLEGEQRLLGEVVVLGADVPPVEVAECGEPRSGRRE